MYLARLTGNRKKGSFSAPELKFIASKLAPNEYNTKARMEENTALIRSKNPTDEQLAAIIDEYNGKPTQAQPVKSREREHTEYVVYFVDRLGKKIILNVEKLLKFHNAEKICDLLKKLAPSIRPKIDLSAEQTKFEFSDPLIKKLMQYSIKGVKEFAIEQGILVTSTKKEGLIEDIISELFDNHMAAKYKEFFKDKSEDSTEKDLYEDEAQNIAEEFGIFQWEDSLYGKGRLTNKQQEEEDDFMDDLAADDISSIEIGQLIEKRKYKLIIKAARHINYDVDSPEFRALPDIQKWKKIKDAYEEYDHKKDIKQGLTDPSLPNEDKELMDFILDQSGVDDTQIEEDAPSLKDFSGLEDDFAELYMGNDISNLVADLSGVEDPSSLGGIEQDLKELNIDDDELLQLELEGLIDPIPRAKASSKLGKVKIGKDYFIPEKPLGISQLNKRVIEEKKEEKTKAIVPSKDCYKNLLGNIKLHDYQERAVNWLLTHDSLLLWHETGSGKSLTAAAAINCVLEANPEMRAIIITKKSLVGNIIGELRKITKNINVLSRVETQTYEKFTKDLEYGEECKDIFVVLDEAHRMRTVIKQEKGKRAGSILSCMVHAKKRLVMTANLVYNSPYDIVNLMAFVRGDPTPLIKPAFDILIKSDSEFKNYFSCYISRYDRPIVTTKKIVNGQQEIHQAASDGYPAVIRRDINLYMSEGYYREYKEIEASMKNIAGVSYKDPGTEAFINGIRSGSNTVTNYESPKIAWCISKVEECLKLKQKIVIYSEFINKGLDLISDRLNDLNIRYLDITGKTKYREETIDQFNNGLYLVLLISKAAAEGVDLKGVRVLIILEPPWSLTLRHQIESRAVRYGSHEGLPKDQQVVELYNLYLNKPINETTEKTRKSADQLVYQASLSKENDIDIFLDKLEKVTIENSPC